MLVFTGQIDYIANVDGVAFIANAERRYDVVIVDGFTHDERTEALCAEAFYRNCRQVLSPAGVLALNLLARDTQVYQDRLARAFDGATLALRTGGSSNVIALAGARVRPDGAERRRHWRALPTVHQHTLAGCAAQLISDGHPSADGSPPIWW